MRPARRLCVRSYESTRASNIFAIGTGSSRRIYCTPKYVIVFTALFFWCVIFFCHCTHRANIMKANGRSQGGEHWRARLSCRFGNDKIVLMVCCFFFWFYLRRDCLQCQHICFACCLCSCANINGFVRHRLCACVCVCLSRGVVHSPRLSHN